ncbi:EAL domain-containing protein [Photobacterium damselae]|uniref:EAL domain-containing protein n=1 Tax=Photobacterium damselae TaxID=38293 RepID=UPI004067982B
MSKSKTILLFICSVIVGLAVNLIWIRFQVNHQTEEMLSTIDAATTQYLNRMTNEIKFLHSTSPACSKTFINHLESTVLKSMSIQEITYINKNQFICSDRGMQEPAQTINIEQLNKYKDNNGYIIYKGKSLRYDIDGLYIMLPVAKHTWYRFLINDAFLKFWLEQHLLDKHIHACVNSLGQTIVCTGPHESQYQHTYHRYSENYNLHFTASFDDEIYWCYFKYNLPYTIILLTIFSSLCLVLAHSYYHRRQSLSAEIQRGIDNHEFIGYYQPIISAKNNRWCGAELLVRWNHPKTGLIPPDQFIHIAERSELIHQMTLDLIKQIALQKTYIEQLVPHSYFSINMTPSMIANTQFVTKLVQILQMNPDLQHGLVIELTEREPFSPAKLLKLKQGMDLLRSYGVKWALDDFGTGYSGLATLQQLSFDILKIDRTFINLSSNDAISLSILDNIAQMGHKLHCSLVAEGVETKEQAQYAKKIGIEACQGYYYAKPMTFDDYYHALKNHLGNRFSPL